MFFLQLFKGRLSPYSLFDTFRFRLSVEFTGYTFNEGLFNPTLVEVGHIGKLKGIF